MRKNAAAAAAAVSIDTLYQESAEETIDDIDTKLKTYHCSI